jgi:peptidoglycan/LPS O-acetylase OafA/YrhL
MFGSTGIHLFVLLSGLGLYLSQLNKPLKFIPFIKKRVTKIYTPYIIIVIISAILSLFIPIYKNSLYALGGHVFLYKMFDESIIGSYGYPLWFISMILQFYLTFNILTWMIKKLDNRYFLIISFIISILWSITVILLNKESERIWNSFFLQFLWEFAIGFIIASTLFKNNYQFNFKLKPIYLLLIGIISSSIYAILAIKGGDTGKVVNDIPALIGYSFIAIWIYKLNIEKLNTFFTFTGKISFAVYLLHILILNTTLYIFNALPILITVSISLITTYLIAIYYQKVIDIFLKRINL